MEKDKSLIHSISMKKILLIIFALTVNHSFAQRYVFFLHNKFIEDNGTEARHPEYGTAAYSEIIDEFNRNNFNVISELRKTNTDPVEYARKIIKQIDSLINIKIPADSITVIGTSKGGFIAMMVSTLLQNENLNYVFIGCCNGVNADINFSGNILSIYEKSDLTGKSCAANRSYSTGMVKTYREIELDTGLKHGFLFKPLPEWLNPSMEWARHNFNFTPDEK